MSSTREKILAWKSEIETVKKEDFRDLIQEREEISQKITDRFTRLQKKRYNGDDEFNQINEEMNSLSQRGKELKAQFEDQMFERFREFADTYPNIYQMFLEGTLDVRTLNHVLDTFDQVEKGHMNQKQGTLLGIDYVTDRYRLPQDFFDRSKVKK